MSRSKEGRTLETCEPLAAYFVERMIINKKHLELDDLVFTESFNHALNGYPRNDKERDTSNDWTPEEVIVLLSQLMQRDNVNFQALRAKRSRIPKNEWAAVDSAITIVLGGERIEARQQRRKSLHDHAEYIREIEALRISMKTPPSPQMRKSVPIVLRVSPETRARTPKKKKEKWTMNLTMMTPRVTKPVPKRKVDSRRAEIAYSLVRE